MKFQLWLLHKIVNGCVWWRQKLIDSQIRKAEKNQISINALWEFLHESKGNTIW